MKIATCTIVGLSPYSPSKYIAEKRGENETGRDWEERIWKERCHWGPDGNAFIPPMAFKKALDAAAQYKSIKVSGRGQATYTKHFKAGILVLEGPSLPVTRDTVEGEWLFLHATASQDTRVEKKEPVVRDWEVTIEFHILDEIIPNDVFETVLKRAGSFIGIGRFRPQNGGYYGRFTVKNIDWKDVD